MHLAYYVGAFFKYGPPEDRETYPGKGTCQRCPKASENQAVRMQRQSRGRLFVQTKLLQRVPFPHTMLSNMQQTEGEIITMMVTDLEKNCNTQAMFSC